MPYNGPSLFILLPPIEELHDQQADQEDAGVIYRHGYSIEEQGNPPDFVLEVASVTTGQNDYTQKRDDYAAFGVPEYWRFDPSGDEYHDAPRRVTTWPTASTSPSKSSKWERPATGATALC